jgi:hypothetical protein
MSVITAANTHATIQLTREAELTAAGRRNLRSSVSVETAGDRQARLNTLLKGIQGMLAASVAIGLAAVVAELNGTDLAGMAVRPLS